MLIAIFSTGYGHDLRRTIRYVLGSDFRLPDTAIYRCQTGLLTRRVVFGRLRKVDKAGPWSAFLKLCADAEWRARYTPNQIYEKTRRFFYFYAVRIFPAVFYRSSNKMGAA